MIFLLKYTEPSEFISDLDCNTSTFWRKKKIKNNFKAVFCRAEAVLTKEEPWRLFRSSTFRCFPSCPGPLALRVYFASVMSRPPAGGVPVEAPPAPPRPPASPPPPPPRRPSLLSPCARCEDVCSETARTWNTGRSGGTGGCSRRFCAAGCAAGTAPRPPWRSRTWSSGTELWDASPREPPGSGPAPPPQGLQQLFQMHVPKITIKKKKSQMFLKVIVCSQ